jgi:hypothetical protein
MGRCVIETIYIYYFCLQCIRIPGDSQRKEPLFHGDLTLVIETRFIR